MKELPQISSKDYIGKDLCKSCSKEVTIKQQAISCDRCEMWEHRSRSDMNIRLYNQCKKKRSFTWICTKCRKDEKMNIDKVDLTKLTKSDLPETIQEILKSNKEMLIIHMNCRSLTNSSLPLRRF